MRGMTDLGPLSLSPVMKPADPPGEPLPGIIKTKVFKEEDYINMPWKNGLGGTKQIAIHPHTADFETEEFIWRLALSEVRDSCSFSVFPGYDIALLLLPEDERDGSASVKNTVHLRRGSLTSPVALHHNDQATAVPLRPLTPYTYSGEWPTSCKIRTGPMRHLTFIANRELTRVTATLETICLHGLHDDGECSDSDEAVHKAPGEVNGTKKDATGNGNGTALPLGDECKNPMNGNVNKLLIGNYSIVYVVSGAVRVTIEGTLEPHTVLAGQTLVCERDDDSSPTDLAMTPLRKDGRAFEKESEHQDATVLIIQVNILRPERRRHSSLSDVSSFSQARPRGRSGSIIVYDDQPLPPLAGIDGDTAASSAARAVAGPSSPTSTIPMRSWDSARHYKPPVFSSRFKNESEVPPAVVRDQLIIDEFPVGAISTVWINMVKQGLSEWLRIPVIVARGKEEGPVVGITAVVHGNELNGVPCIHRVISDIDVSTLKGTVVAVPCINVPGYLRYTREFSDGKDLNRMFPGSPTGTASQIYAYNIMEKVVGHFNYLIDLHTASFGRVNSYYVRSDMNDAASAAMAKLQQPQVILHNSGQDGALRSAAMTRNIKAITVEIGNPQQLQNQYVQWSYQGVMRILSWLNMFQLDPADLAPAAGPPSSTILCSKGYWIYTKTGGVLEVYPSVNTVVRKGDLIARIKNIFGNIVDEVYAPGSGVTIGRSSNPVAMAGDRVLHMGVIKREGEVLAREAKENY
ncbi:hypothetical protein PhCBS80983_g03883 [Powellomyces hirtus]|uniref:Succinylglutamate desuccinylase/Aspartoacylase catalytic domain-containing protein n=1 Tax=Powellomyces hirtus TaxID=109895 RepID=A0A507E0T9_9FUNG|nr:hypothetical protein PhCBS80983_g03883 [Powellomyces hirtus]